MNGKILFIRIVGSLITIALVVSLFCETTARAAILFGVLCTTYFAYQIVCALFGARNQQGGKRYLDCQK